MITNYCEKCKQKYNLNNRIFKIFSSTCDICGAINTSVYCCSLTIIDKCLNVIIWEYAKNIQINGRNKQILIKTFVEMFKGPKVII